MDKFTAASWKRFTKPTILLCVSFGHLQAQIKQVIVQLKVSSILSWRWTLVRWGFSFKGGLMQTSFKSQDLIEISLFTWNALCAKKCTNTQFP